MRDFYNLNKDDKEFIKHYKDNAGRILNKKYITGQKTIKPKYLRLSKILEEFERQ